MECFPELSVTKRKTLSITKAAKRLRRFVQDNQASDSGVANVDGPDSERPAAGRGELVCSVPDETLFQLQQICEALEAKSNRRATMAALPSLLLPHEPANASVETPKRKSSKKRSRADDEAKTDVKEDVHDKGFKHKKKARRKSTAN